MIVYEIKPGDSIYSIARRYGMSMDKIIADNELENPNRLAVGQSIVLMTDTIPHIVRRGDSLYSISRAYRVDLEQLKSANPTITSPYILSIGQVVNVPVPTKKRGLIYVNGYAFPNINMATLEKTLPYLTYLSIFSHQARPDGSLIPINDTRLIETARNANVAPLMVVTNIEEGASFSSQLAHTLLSNPNVSQNLINNIESNLKSKNYHGVDIDFEYIYPEDADNYNNFLKTLTRRLNPQGFIVTTALAPKTSATQKGLLYEAHQYPMHGLYANHIILMTYEWGYTFGPPLAVSPINEVKKVLDYAITVIPSEKILMGMPNYGYDWTLPYKQGSAARSLSLKGALNIALRENVAIQYYTKAQSPYFRYIDNSGARHIVWFDDAKSINEKLKLVDVYNLGGVSYWTINQFFPQNWLILSSMYDIRKVI
ncbi:MAG: LysM peptidoglycan-binding domain-containing protein [Clostridiales bacterium]|nr:LysM peptidoglycan-binding domain-containing protein [Clostridiales bacterium]